MNKLFPMVVSVGVAMLTGVAAADYQLVEGVYTISVAQGQTQTNLTDDDKTALADAACTELRKAGEGTLQLDSATGISKFKGKITVAEGTYTVNVGSGALGTGDGPTEVLEGATLCFLTYTQASAYQNEDVFVGGTGYNGGGALRRENPTDTGTCVLSFNRLTLTADTLVITTHDNRGLELKPRVFDMGGFDFRSEGMNGGYVCIEPSEQLLNDGNIYLKSSKTNYLFPNKVDMLGGPDHVLTIDAVGYPSYSVVHTNRCNWTLRFVNPGSGLRIYHPPFLWDGPVELPSSGKIYLTPNNNPEQDDPALRWMRFNGPISGGAQIVNGGDSGAYLLLAGTNTCTGGFTWSSSNAGGVTVAMVPEAIPNMFSGGVTYPAYQNSIAVSPRTASNPGGWEWTAITNAWEQQFLHYSGNIQIFVPFGETYVQEADFGPEFNYYWRNNSSLRGGACGGETIIKGSYDLPSWIKNFVGESMVLTVKDGFTGTSTFKNFNTDGGRLTFRDMGYFTIYSLAVGVLGINTKAEVVFEGNSVLGKSDYTTTIGQRSTTIGACGQIIVGEGAVFSNAISIAGQKTYINSHGELLVRGGAFVSTGDSYVSGSTNSTAAVKVESGTFEMPANSLYLARHARSCGAVFRQTGGAVTIGSEGEDGGNLNFGSGTATVHVVGGTFRAYGRTTMPISLKSVDDPDRGGRAILTVDGGSVSLDGGIFLCDRCDAEAVVDLNGGELRTTQISRKLETSNTKVPVTGAYASVNFNGGCLKAAVDGELFGTGETAPDAVHVRTGGAAFDTDGHDATVSVPLAAMPVEGGIVSLAITNVNKEKAVVARTLTSYHSCPTILIVGDGHGATAIADYDYDTKKVTGVTVTNPGWGYTAAGTKAYVFLQGSKNPDSTTKAIELAVTVGDNAASGGLVKRGAGTLTLGAANTYAGSTVVEGGTLKFGVAGALPEGSAIVSRGGAVAAADYADVPKEIAFDVADPDPKAKIVLARWDTCTVGEPTASDFTVTGLPDEWQVAVRGNTLVASKPRGTLLLIK